MTTTTGNTMNASRIDRLIREGHLERTVLVGEAVASALAWAWNGVARRVARAPAVAVGTATARLQVR